MRRATALLVVKIIARLRRVAGSPRAGQPRGEEAHLGLDPALISNDHFAEVVPRKVSCRLNMSIIFRQPETESPTIF